MVSMWKGCRTTAAENRATTVYATIDVEAARRGRGLLWTAAPVEGEEEEKRRAP